jgi:hypothetical protein
MSTKVTVERDGKTSVHYFDGPVMLLEWEEPPIWDTATCAAVYRGEQESPFPRIFLALVEDPEDGEGEELWLGTAEHPYGRDEPVKAIASLEHLAKVDWPHKVKVPRP